MDEMDRLYDIFKFLARLFSALFFFFFVKKVLQFLQIQSLSNIKT